MSDDAFSRYLQSLGETPPTTAGEAILSGIPDALVGAIKRCAIPHHFDAEVLAALYPELKEDQLVEMMDALVVLPVVSGDTEGLFIHDAVRKRLFREWLHGDQLEQFKDLSRALVAIFQQRALQKDDGWRHDKSVIFHFLAYDQERATALFDWFFQQDRQKRHVGSRQTILEWAQEYEDYLTSPTRIRLKLYAGIVAAELRKWDEATEAFGWVAQAVQVNEETYVKAKLGLAQSFAELHQPDRAVEACNASFDSAQAHSETLTAEVLLVWGRVLLNVGRLDDAERRLTESAALATKRDNNNGAAEAFNALGTLYRKRNDPRNALLAFKKALSYLDSQRDIRLIAGISNNMGILLSDLNDWSEAEKYLSVALRTYREIQDKHGEATALNNLLRINLHAARYDEAISNAEAAARLFVEMYDYRAGALAHVNLSSILHKKGRTKASDEQLSEAIHLFERMNSVEEANFYRKRLGTARKTT